MQFNILENFAGSKFCGVRVWHYQMLIITTPNLTVESEILSAEGLFLAIFSSVFKTETLDLFGP